MAWGIRVGEVARSHVPGGVLIRPGPRHKRIKETRDAMRRGAAVVYEACFEQDCVFVATDVLQRSGTSWALTEVKSATKLKPEYIPDAAIQAAVLRDAGVDLDRVEIMHLNREHVFGGDDLFRHEDVTHQVTLALPLIREQAKRQLDMLGGPLPNASVGEQCFAPYECPFMSRCWPALKNHISTLYRIRRSKMVRLFRDGYETIDQLPETDTFGPIAERQRQSLRSGRMVIEPGLARELRVLREPVAYLDFEAVMLPIPAWPGCRPYDAVPVQFSCHVVHGRKVTHHEWIADGPVDPREALAHALVDAVRGAKTVAAYCSSFEKRCIEHLADAVPELRTELRSILKRLVDLLPTVRNHVYHPEFHGSFSLKKVYPAVVPGTGYSEMDVADGMTAAVELERLMFDKEMTEVERAPVKVSLLKYCKLDTLALVELVTRLRQLAMS